MLPGIKRVVAEREPSRGGRAWGLLSTPWGINGGAVYGIPGGKVEAADPRPLIRERRREAGGSERQRKGKLGGRGKLTLLSCMARVGKKM